MAKREGVPKLVKNAKWRTEKVCYLNKLLLQIGGGEKAGFSHAERAPKGQSWKQGEKFWEVYRENISSDLPKRVLDFCLFPQSSYEFKCHLSFSVVSFFGRQTRQRPMRCTELP